MSSVQKLASRSEVAAGDSALTWRRFRSLLGPHLRMGVETILHINEEIDPLYHESSLVITRPPVQFVFHPSAANGGDLRTSDETRIVFAPHFDLGGCRSKVVLFRKGRGRGKMPWAVAARFPTAIHPESRVFGFSAARMPRSRYYLPLALPGEVIGEDGKPTFVPLFIKLVDWESRECTYIRVGARVDFEEGDPENPSFFVVVARRVGCSDVPPILRQAMPRGVDR